MNIIETIKQKIASRRERKAVKRAKQHVFWGQKFTSPHHINDEENQEEHLP